MLPFRATIDKSWTPQKLFDTLIEASEAGSFPSYNSGDARCCYRHGDKACAMGIFIPPEQEGCIKEGDCASSLITDYGLKLDLPEWMDGSLFDSVQSCHDSVCIQMVNTKEKTWLRNTFRLKLIKIFKARNLYIKELHENVE